MELRRQKVLDLSSAIATTNGLVIFDVVASKGDNGASEISFKIKDKDEMMKKKKFGGGRIQLGYWQQKVRREGQRKRFKAKCTLLHL